MQNDLKIVVGKLFFCQSIAEMGSFTKGRRRIHLGAKGPIKPYSYLYAVNKETNQSLYHDHFLQQLLAVSQGFASLQ